MGDRHAPVDDAWREDGPRRHLEARRRKHEALQNVGRTRVPHDQAGVMLFAALYAFFQEHQYCGDLDGGVEGNRVWTTCRCGR